MQSLGTFPGGTYTFAAGVSDDGAVVTGYGDDPTAQRAYRWTSATGLVSLGAPAGTNQVFGYSVNADGTVVVGDSDSAIGDVAFRWSSVGGMQSLGTLSGGTFSFAYAVSANGLVVVGDSDSTVGDVAYRWTMATGIVSLGTLPMPFAYMVSNAVNADGSVIVGSSIAATGTAFLWTNSLGIVDLNTYLPTLGINLTGWALTDAGGVSADGTIIAGTGIHNGVEEAWIANLLGPSGTSFCFGDGTATACPCSNSGGQGRGCASSVNANGALLTVTGIAHVAFDSTTLSGAGMPNSSCLYFQGTSRQNAGLGAVFGDGLRCAGGAVIRLGTKSNVAGASQYPAVGDPSISVRGAVPAAGGTRTYQAWYRNAAAFCTASVFNLSNGIEVVWVP